LEQGEIGRVIRKMRAATRIEGMSEIKFMFTNLNHILGYAYLEAGVLNIAADHATVAVEAAAGLPFFLSQVAQALQARISLLLGDVERARQTFATIGEMDAETTSLFKFYLVPISFAGIEIDLALGREDAAISKVALVSAITDKLPLKIFLPEALYLKGRTLLAQGQVVAAKAALAQAQGVAVEIGNRRILWQILVAQAEAAEDVASAAQLRELARTEVNFLAEQMGSAELQASFLARPDVQQVMTAT
jgi:hypothetical protein